MSREIIDLTDEQANGLKADGLQHLSEADRIALTSRTNPLQVLRKIANRHIAQNYPTTVAVGLAATARGTRRRRRLDTPTGVREPRLR